MRSDIGRNVFGLAAIVFGILALTSRDFRSWQQVQILGDTLLAHAVWYAAGTAQLAGGVAMLWRRGARVGAALAGAAFLLFALLAVPAPLHDPRVYNNWNAIAEQLSMAAGALVVYVEVAHGDAEMRSRVIRAGSIVFGVCIASFALEQIFYVRATASLVPAWIPPGKTFWVMLTTVAFALAAVALVSGRVMPLAARLLAAMLVLFGLLIWVPAIATHASDPFAWSEGAETLAIAAAAWVIGEAWDRRRA